MKFFPINFRINFSFLEQGRTGRCGNKKLETFNPVIEINLTLQNGDDLNFSSFLKSTMNHVSMVQGTREKCWRETSIAVKRIYRGTRARFARTVERIMTLRGSGSLAVVERKSVQDLSLESRSRVIIRCIRVAHLFDIWRVSRAAIMLHLSIYLLNIYG